MPNRSPEVDRFMECLNHPLNEEVARLRSAILDSNDRITEHIKWKAPSYRYAGEDRVTFRLYPVDRVQLVFHRGAKGDAGDFAFDDGTGLLRWVAEDRAVVALQDVEDAEAKRPARRHRESVGRNLRTAPSRLCPYLPGCVEESFLEVRIRNSALLRSYRGGGPFPVSGGVPGDTTSCGTG